MGQIGQHEYEDATDPLASAASNVGQHAFDKTDNTGSPCNGLSDCSGCTTDDTP